MEVTGGGEIRKGLGVLWAAVASFAELGRGGLTCETISAARDLRDKPLARMKTSAMAGFLTVANETKTIFVRSSC